MREWVGSKTKPWHGRSRACTQVTASTLPSSLCLKKGFQEISRLRAAFRHSFFPLKTKCLAAVPWRSPPWARICMTEQVRKRRSQVTYAWDTASSSGQSNEAAARKPLPVFQTLKKNVRSAASKTAGYGASKLVETREEVPRKEALEEMFAASRKRFLAIASSILRKKEDAEDAVQDA